jgi:predicted anti-sigma-YlaC factor YlaD
MNVVSIWERSCEHYRQRFDAYLDNELAGESRHVVLLHVCSCSDCAGVLDSRSSMKQLLRNAVGREESPVELVKALRIRFRPKQQGFFAYNTAGWMVAAATVLIPATGVMASLSFRL